MRKSNAQRLVAAAILAVAAVVLMFQFGAFDANDQQAAEPNQIEATPTDATKSGERGQQAVGVLPKPPF